MPRNRQSSLKARDKNLAKNPNYYSDIAKLAAQSRRNKIANGEPVKPHGFATMDKKRHKEISKRGGQSKRKDNPIDNTA